MKIKVYLNKVKVDVNDDFDKARDYFLRHGIPIEWEFVQSDLKNLSVQLEDFGLAGTRYQLTGHQSQLGLTKDGVTIFVFDGDKFSPIPASKCNSTPEGILITLMTYKAGDKIGESYLTLIHEVMHSLFQLLQFKQLYFSDPMDVLYKNGEKFLYYKNDQPESSDSNFGEAWRILTPHLNKLTIMATKYTYFTDKEIIGLKPELVSILDQARGIAGVPFAITSGYRTVEHNNEVGGVPNSAHTKGLAVDLNTPEKDHAKRMKILWGLMQFRDKLFIEICRSHIHVDTDSSIHPMGQVMWANDD